MKFIVLALLSFSSPARAESYFCLSTPELPDVLYVLTARETDDEPVPRVHWVVRYEGPIALGRITSTSWEAAVAGARVTHALNARETAPEAEALFDSSEEFGNIELRRADDRVVALAAPLISPAHVLQRRIELRAHVGEDEESTFVFDGKPVASILYQHCGED